MGILLTVYEVILKCDLNCVKCDFQKVMEISIMTLYFFLVISGAKNILFKKKLKKNLIKNNWKHHVHLLDIQKKIGMRKKIDVYLSLSTGLKPGRMCLKLLFLSSLG